MANLNVCRICLRTEGKMYDYDKFKLKLFYEQLMSVEVKDPDYLPHYFCYECATMLHKFHKFKEKCQVAQRTIEDLMWENTLPTKAVQDIDRKSKNLLSPLALISKTARVKSYIVKSTTPSKPPKTLSKQTKSRNKRTKIESVNTNLNPVPIHFANVSSLDIEDTKNEINYLEPEIFLDKTKVFKIEDESDIKINIKTDDNTQIDDKKDEINLEIPINDNFNDTDANNYSDNDLDDIKLSDFKMALKTDKDTPKRKINKVENTVQNATKAKKFERKKRQLDPNDWFTETLTEEQAIQEFAARAQDSRYFTAEFKCTKCMKGFSKEDMLKRHLKLRHNEANPRECRFCKMTFRQQCFQLMHMEEHYKRYKCLRCNLVFKGKIAIAYQHEDVHSGIIRKCEHCGKEFRHLNTYNSHLRMSHRSEHVCTLCGASFINNKGLWQHKKMVHMNYEEPDAVEGLGEYCSRCDIRFETRAAYDEHFAHSAKHDDNNDMEGNTPKLLKPKIKDVSKRVFTRKNHPTDCHTCGKHFHSQASFRKHHQAEHPGTALFAPHQCLVCEICGKSVYPSSMRQHLMTHGDTTYGSVECPVCHKRFANSSNMGYHYKTQHETDPAKRIEKSKKFTCDVCGVVVSQKVSLKRHMRIHTGERPYECELCGKRFTQSNSMKLHFRTIHLKEPHPKRKPRKPGATKTPFYHENNEEVSKGSIDIKLLL